MIDSANQRFFELGLRLLLGLALAVVVLQPLFAPGQSQRAAAVMLMVPTAGLALWFARRQRLDKAVTVTVYGSWLVISANALVNGGVFSASLYGYPLIIAICGWMLGMRAASWLAALTALVEAALALAGVRELIQAGPPPAQWQWAIHALLLVATITFVSFSVRAYEERLSRIRSLSEELADKVRAVEQREAELARSESKFSQVFHASPVAISVTRMSDGLCVDINQTYLDQFGWSRDEVVGHTMVEIGLWPSPEARRRWLDAVAESGGHARNFEHVLLTKGGDPRTVQASSEVVRIDDVDYALVYVNDVTERRQAEQAVRALNAELESRVEKRTHELTEANQELESFAYSISHDLRAPLRGIDGFSRLLEEEYGERLDESGREYLGRVRRAAQRMGTLIDDLLELSRVARQEMQRRPVNLSALAEEILAGLADTAPERRVLLRIEPDCRTEGDPQLLRVLLENLLGNAWKYSGKVTTPVIEFGIAKVGASGTAFFVRDNGAGFDMTYADKLFAPFQRLHSPNEFEGSGIGLASAARVVRRHGGRIWAEAAPGKGACFHFTLGRPDISLSQN